MPPTADPGKPEKPEKPEIPKKLEQPEKLEKLVDALGLGWNKSHIQPLELLENVAGGRGAHTTFSILEPEMTIERTDSKEYPEYRIVAYFKLQVKIHAFEKG
jgi:hypothetical protein